MKILLLLAAIIIATTAQAQFTVKYEKDVFGDDIKDSTFIESKAVTDLMDSNSTLTLTVKNNKPNITIKVGGSLPVKAYSETNYSISCKDGEGVVYKEVVAVDVGEVGMNLSNDFTDFASGKKVKIFIESDLLGNPKHLFKLNCEELNKQLKN
jgi:hypothetical protein